MDDKKTRIIRTTVLTLLVLFILNLIGGGILSMMAVSKISSEYSYLAAFILSIPTLLYVIAFIVCIIFILKSRPWAYLLTSLLVFLININSYRGLLKFGVGITLDMIPFMILWLVLIVLSYYMYRQLKKEKTNKR